MSIEPASSEIDFAQPVVTAPLQQPTNESYKNRVPDEPYKVAEVNIDDEPETFHAPRGRTKDTAHRSSPRGPRVMVMNLFTKDIFELARGPLTRGEMLDLTEGFNPKYWQVQIWNAVRTGPSNKLVWAGLDG